MSINKSHQSQFIEHYKYIITRRKEIVKESFFSFFVKIYRMIKLGAKELRTSSPTPEDLQKIKKNPIYIVLDNVLDTYNVGSIFRLADAVAAQKVFLCGQTETPPNSRIKKASINTTEWVKWEYCETAAEAIGKLRKKWDVGSEKMDNEVGSGKENQNPNISLQNLDSHITPHTSIKIIAVEQSPKSILYTQLKVEFPMAIVVGNETYGISKDVLEMADEIVEIPMFGVNKSLNVMVSLAVVLFEIMKRRGEV